MQKNNSVRVRFAPSPTGHLHIGGLRAALFNWLYARNNNGVFLVRIEDTDLERSKPEYTESILASLAWTGIEPDESITLQTQRVDEHKKYIQQLLDSGKAYRCYCSPEEVIERNKQKHGADYLFASYDGFCRDASNDAEKLFVMRFKLPQQKGAITFTDLIRGKVTFDYDQLDDFIIARSDGSPMYNFVVVIDDHHMNISHVIRGEDHISNTPKQMLLYQALGFEIPIFAHLPLILGPSGDRLSKRDAATSVLEYKTGGYLPDALVNYLVRLGWAHGDQEVFTRKELIEYFSLDNVGKKGAIFDPAKLDWLNGVYIRDTSNKQVLDNIIYSVEPNFVQKCSSWDDEKIDTALELFKQRTKTLHELVQEICSFYNGPKNFNTDDCAKWTTPETVQQLTLLLQKLEGLASFTAESITAEVKSLAKELGIKLVALAQPVRIALLGKASGPGVFALLALLGKKEGLQRITHLVAALKK